MAASLVPMMGLRVADNGDGTVTATVTGCNFGIIGRTLGLHYAVWDGKHKSYQWQLLETEDVSAGTMQITAGIDYGYYVWQVLEINTNTGLLEQVSQIVLRNVVNPDYRAVWDRCVEATKVNIDTLNLDGIPDTRVVPMWYPTYLKDVAPEPPCIVIAPFGPEQYRPMLNDNDNVGYGVIVVVIDRANRESKVNFARDLLWREKIMRMFRHQRLAGVTEIWDTTPEPDTLVHPEAWKSNMLVQAVLFRFYSREPRGLT